MKELLAKINGLKSDLSSFEPLNAEGQNLLWEKYRLEWNFNSNHIEGNTMTYGQTELLLRLGDDFRAQNNSLRDVNEMRAHDTAIYMIRDWAQDASRQLIEKDIRELNELILVKDYWSEAQTPDGRSTPKRIKVGEYKAHPNHVRLASGDIFKYAEPHEVPAKMNDLISWYAGAKNEHPLIVAAYLHYKFVVIHPFDDGNGRVSRLLMNLHLMKNGFPPLIIKSEDKKNYLYALSQADTGDFDSFVAYLGNQLIWSLEIALKAARGESIEEDGDLKKEIAVWKKNEAGSLKNSPKRDGGFFRAVYIDTVRPIFTEIVRTIETEFIEFYPQMKFMTIAITTTSGLRMLDNISDENLKEKFSPLKDDHIAIELRLTLIKKTKAVLILDEDVFYRILVSLDEYSYYFNFENDSKCYEKDYSMLFSKKEISEVTNKGIREIFEKIKLEKPRRN